MEQSQARKLAVILHADIVGSTELVQRNETIAHARIKDVFHRFSATISSYGGTTHELRGDALVAQFERASDAVSASLAFQIDNATFDGELKDDIRPQLRVGISMGEVVIADNTVTGAGVVLAQRLEQLAEPGGVCVQGAAYETVPQRLPFAYESLGEQEVKGFSEPVRVYTVALQSGQEIPAPESSAEAPHTSAGKSIWPRIAIGIATIAAIFAGGLAWWQQWRPVVEPASIDAMAFPLPDKPSIAILPFNNMSDDPSQDYFADGMTEDLITDISKLSGLFVIARNTMFSYKGKAVKVSQVAEDLGVRYVLEGSVRRAGDKVRINAQLIDAVSGGHLWAERYDGSLSDIFAVQDQVTSKIVSALSLNLTPVEQQALAKKGTTNSEAASPQAYDEFLKGWELRWRVNRESYARAEQHFKKALDYDPDYARAHAGLALLYMQIWQKGWHQDSGSPSAGWHRAREHLEAAMSNPDSLTHSLRSTLELHNRRHDKAISEARQAVALNPSSAEGHLVLAEALSYSGEPMEAIYNVELAQRLDPNLPGSYLVVQGRALFDRMAYQGAVRTLDKAREEIPDDTQSLIYQIAAYGHLGDSDYAGVALDQLNKLLKSDNLPSFTLSALRNRLPYKSTEALQHLRDGLIKGGVPEK